MKLKRSLIAGTALTVAGALMLTACGGGASGSNETPGETGSARSETFAPGTIEFYAYGQPQYRAQFFNGWLEDNDEIASGVSLEMIQTEGEADARQRLITSLTAGATKELPDVIQTGLVNMIDMADAGALLDLTDYINGMADDFVDGAVENVTHNGKIYGLPVSVRPQVLFYNNAIFEEYGIDPAKMDTMEGYLEVGRELKKASSGEVYLSYVDPGDRSWRYWMRRGLMPQAGAKIWDDAGEVVIDTDPGAKIAFEYFESLVYEDLLLKSKIMEAPLYEATADGKVATYYIGAFWDEFLRGNVTDMAGDWRVMPAPVFEDIGMRGAPVTEMFSLIDSPDAQYQELFKMMWKDYQFNPEMREDWTTSMVEQNAPYTNPIVKSMLERPFWKEPADFYGGQSFREAEGVALVDAAPNMRVTTDDAEADVLISNELEKYIAGAQTMDQAIENMGNSIRSAIGSTDAIQ